jgi:hypothetical protein
MKEILILSDSSLIHSLIPFKSKILTQKIQIHTILINLRKFLTWSYILIKKLRESNMDLTFLTIPERNLPIYLNRMLLILRISSGLDEKYMRALLISRGILKSNSILGNQKFSILNRERIQLLKKKRRLLFHKYKMNAILTLI